MNHKGTKEIETERLILRAFKETDAEDMFNNWARDEKVTKFLTWLSHENIEVSKKACKIRENESKDIGYYQWVIILKDGNTAIGSIGLVKMDNERKSGEVGYCIGYKWWGKGYVNEALAAILDYLKPVGFVRIQALHNIANHNSGKVLLKCGFEYEGTLKKYSLNNQNQLIDEKMYSIIFEENIK